jgi:hypothetical protein
MVKSGIDQDAIIKMFSEASTKQGEALRKAVSEGMLKALQGRELTLKNIRSALKTMTQAASAGAAQNPAPAVDVEAMLSNALAGMDAALLKAVEANRKALEQFVAQGVGLQEKQLKSALSEVEKLEDTFFDTVSKAVAADNPLQKQWEQVLSASKLKGSDTGVQAASTVQNLMAQAQTALRDTRASSVKAAQAMLESYSALVSGVLIGMSEGLQQGGAVATKRAPAKK